MKILSKLDVFLILMRRLNEIAIRMPTKEAKKVLYLISQLENLEYFPNDIRTDEQYNDESV